MSRTSGAADFSSVLKRTAMPAARGDRPVREIQYYEKQGANDESPLLYLEKNLSNETVNRSGENRKFH